MKMKIIEEENNNEKKINDNDNILKNIMNLIIMKMKIMKMKIR